MYGVYRNHLRYSLTDAASVHIRTRDHGFSRASCAVALELENWPRQTERHHTAVAQLRRATLDGPYRRLRFLATTAKESI